MKIVKVGGVVGTIGSVAGGAIALAVGRSNPTSDIVKKFKEVGYEMLDVNNDTGWEEVLKEYKNAPDNERFEGNKEDLRAQCKEALKKNDNKTYGLAKRWCVKKESIKQMLQRQGFKTLDTTTNNNNQIWKDKVQELINTGNNKIKIGGGITGNMSVDVVTVWGTCKIIKENTSTTSKEYEEEFIKAKDWCSTK